VAYNDKEDTTVIPLLTHHVKSDVPPPR